MGDTQYRDIDIEKTWVTQSTLNFTRYFFKHLYKRKFIVGDHHRIIADALDRVVAGECTRLIINIAPRYGKTELAVKNFIAYGLAMNPAAKFIHLSYSDALARDNSRGVQDIIRHESFVRLFPDCKPTSVNTQRWRTSQDGGLYAISSAGQVTGFGAGIVDREEEEQMASELEEMESSKDETQAFGGAIIIDDPIKPDDARSELLRTKVNQKFETTIRNRVNSRNTPIIIIMQRLDEDDLCGYLTKLEPEEWTVIKLPCIMTDDDGERRALWPFKHTLEELDDLKQKNSYVFETQYMQNPQPLEGLMYEREFKTYTLLPASRHRIRKNYTDTADEGTDNHCSIDYVETEFGNYILSILYTKKPMEYTEQAQAEQMTRDGIEEANIESNNGGRSFARTVEKNMRIMGNNTTRVKWFHQSENKNVRIFTHSNEVQNLTYFPEGWERLWPDFYHDLTQYMKIGTNAHDDAPDALTGTVEKRGNMQRQRASGFF